MVEKKESFHIGLQLRAYLSLCVCAHARMCTRKRIREFYQTIDKYTRLRYVRWLFCALSRITQSTWRNRTINGRR